MASTFQQQSLRRKVIYTVLILVLFTATLLLRQAGSYGMEAQADALELREQSLGEVELSGSALRLSLSGARGAAVCFLWWTATEKQKRHEWNELEMLVQSLTKLQPHFVTPWLFQSWNLAYNVSVESDRIRDKYFYITRGIELLGEGERQNRDNPDLRFSMGFTNQHKIGLADEAHTLRCLFNMSTIDPLERDAGPNPNNPKALRKQEAGGNIAVDMNQFEQFCRNHPMLVRRLHDALKRETPADVIDFLADNHKIPSRFDEKATTPGAEQHSVLKPVEQQFPVLPPQDPGRRRVASPTDPDFNNFVAARDWFAYSLEPMPPPPPDLAPNTNFTYDPRKYRMPRYMAHQIFRGYPSRGQTYVADYLEREGWFDTDGWKIPGWFADDKFQDGSPAVVGTATNWGVRAWEEAFNLWKNHGTITKLYLTDEQLEGLRNKAQAYRTRHNLKEGDLMVPLSEDETGPDIQASYAAALEIFWYDRYREMTNFPHFFNMSQVEALPETVDVKKGFFDADQLRKAGDREQALELYRTMLPKWRAILLAHEGYRNDLILQEDSYEVLLRYQELVQDLRGRRLKELGTLGSFLARASFPSTAGGVWIPPAYFARDVRIEVATPLDGNNPEFISPDTVNLVRSRMRLPLPPSPTSLEQVSPVSLPHPEAAPPPGMESPSTKQESK